MYVDLFKYFYTFCINYEYIDYRRFFSHHSYYEHMFWTVTRTTLGVLTDTVEFSLAVKYAIRLLQSENYTKEIPIFFT